MTEEIIAIHFYAAVTQPQMCQHLGITTHMQTVAVVRAVFGMAPHRQADTVAAIPGNVAAGGRSGRDALAAGQTAQEKTGKVKALLAAFNASWAEIEEVMPLVE